MDAAETAIVHAEQKKIEGTGFVKDTHSLKSIADKTVNLPADPASEAVVTGAVSTSEGVVTGAISTSEGVVTGAVSSAHGVTDGKVDAVQSDIDLLELGVANVLVDTAAI